MSITNKLKKKLFYFSVSLLPKPLRHGFYRKNYARVPSAVPAGLTFELARTKEELEAAFKLLHDAYVEQGFITPHPSGMRLIIQHALPTTSILVAKMNHQVIGTISIMRDTALGLPMEKVFDINHLKKNGKRVAELSCLAIHPNFRRNMGGHIFFPLTLFASMFAERSFGTDYLVWNLYPQHADFYNAIFGSSHLSQEAKDYLGAPASAIQLDLAGSYNFAKQKYQGLGIKKDLFKYTYVTKHSYFKYPLVEDGSINHPVMTPAIFEYFFSQKTDILKNLSVLEEQVVARYYPLSSYAAVIPINKFKIEEPRSNIRWDTRLTAHLKDKASVTVLDISESGFRAYAPEDLVLYRTYEFEIKLDSGEKVIIKAKPIWKKTDSVYGFKLLEANKIWERLVENQASKLKQLVS